MKVRVILMTENGKHIDDKYPDEEVKRIAEIGWKRIIDGLNQYMASESDKMYLEGVEIVER